MTDKMLERKAMAMMTGGLGMALSSLFMALDFDAFTIGLSGVIIATVGGVAVWRLADG